VQHQDPFYQLGKLYVYKLQVELFQYASERISTGIQEIDNFETLKSLVVDPAETPPTVDPVVDAVESFGDNNKFKVEGATIAFDEDNPFGEVV
jgi:hypothetical protein